MTKAIDKLQQQEHAATAELQAKEADHADAREAMTKAATAYDSVGDVNAEKAWLRAKEAEQLAGMRLESARRKLAAATKQREDAARAELARKRDELLAKVSRSAVVAASAQLADSEARARRAVAEVIQQRLQLSEKFRTLQRELNVILVALGEPRRDTDESELACSPVDVRNLLNADIATLAATNRRLAELLRDLIPIKY